MLNQSSKVPARVRRHLSICLACVLVAGCGNREKDSADKGTVPSGGITNIAAGPIVGTNEKSFVEMRPEDVLVSVNGVALKRGECDALLERMAQTYQAAHPNARLPDVVSYRTNRAKTFVGEFLTKQLLLQEARRRNLVPSPESKAKMADVLAKRAKLEKKTPEAYLRSVGEKESREILADLEEQALISTLRENEFGERLKVSDKDIQALRDRIAGYNRMCEATNALVKARGVAVCERLRKGEDFAKVAAEVTEDPGEGDVSYWGEFARGEIEDAGVRNAAFTLPVGAVSDPLDTEEGLVIIKVLDRKGVDAVVAAASATVKLGRIVLRLGEFKTVPEDDQVLRAKLERERLGELQTEWLKRLQQQARIEYPNGTNFWKKVTRK